MLCRCLLSRLLATLLLVSLTRMAAAESGSVELPCDWQVRTTDYRVVTAIAQGLRDSSTFRELVDRLNASDVIVYVMVAAASMPTGVDGRLTFLSASGGFRYVVVHVNTTMATHHLVALLAHELQHAREIADTSAIVDSESMARAYATGLGYQKHALLGERAYDSDAAIDAGQKVLKEMLAAE